MNNQNKIWIIVGIIVLAIFLIPQMSKESKKIAGETMNRQISGAYVNPGGTFSLKYLVNNPQPPYFFSIKDGITGGCTLTTSGGNQIITTVTSPNTATSDISVNAPSTTGFCYFNGDYQLGSNPLVSFAQGSIEVCNAVNCVQSAWTPATNIVCGGFTYSQTRTITTPATCGGTCGTTSQSATGNKDCGSTPSITTTDTFSNGCVGGTAGTCKTCFTYGDGFSSSCVKDKNTCSNGVDRTELGCVAQEWINGAGQAVMRRYLGDSAQDWINKGGQN